MFCADSGKSEIARDRLRQPSTNQIAVLPRATLAIYQSYLPDGRNHPVYIAHRTSTQTYQSAHHTTSAHATIVLRSRHETNPRSTRFVSGKATECKRRPRRHHVDPLSRRREVAHGVLRSLPKPEKTTVFFLPREEGSRFFVVCFLHTSRRYTARCGINPRSTRFVSGKAR